MTHALHFDGINDYLDLGDLGVFEDKDGGFVTWLWLPDVEGDHVVFSEYNSAGAHHVTLTIKDATLEAVAHDGTNTTTLTGGTLSAETQHHVALAADGTDLLLYVDGALVDSDTLPPLALTLDTTVLGRNEAGTDYLFGALSQARCYDSGPTAAEVLADYEAGDWPPELPPVELRPLFDGLLAVLCGDGSGAEDLTDVARNLRFTTTTPGGFGEASFRLPASDPFQAYSLTVVRGAPVTIAHGEQTLFEGVIVNDVAAATITESEAYYEVAAAGKWYEAGQREDALLAYCDTDFDQWEVTKGRGQPSKFETDNDGRLSIVALPGAGYVGQKGTGLHYWLHNGLGDPDEHIDHIIFVLGDYGDGSGRGFYLPGGGADWRASVQRGDSPYDADLAADIVYTTTTAEDAGTIHRVPATAGVSLTTPARCVRLRLYPYADSTITAARYLVIKEMYVMVNTTEVAIDEISEDDPPVVTTFDPHGLKVGDRVFIWGGTEAPYWGINTVLSIPTTTTFTIDHDPGILGSGGTMERIPSPVDAMKDIGEAIGGGSSAIDDSCYAAALPGSVMVRPHTTWAEALAELETRFSTPVIWAWWEDGEFVMDTLDASPTVTYEVDAGLPGVTYDVHRDTEGQPDYVRVLYKLDDSTSELHGQVVQAVVPTDPGYGIGDERIALLDLSGTPMTTADAEDVGTRYLAWLGADVWTGRITIKAPTVDLVAGGTYPTPYIRAGEWVREASHLQECFITTTEYDVDACTMTLTIGAPPGEFDFEEAR